MNRSHVETWLEKLKHAWEGKDVDAATSLFKQTKLYFERPFAPGTTPSDIESYWSGIVDLDDIIFTYEIFAIEGNHASVHWENWYTVRTSGKRDHLDGVFHIEFNSDGACEIFRQWWFMEG